MNPLRIGMNLFAGTKM